MSAFVQRLGRAYARQLEKMPFRTQMVTSGILWGLGDVVAQRTSPQGVYDGHRTIYNALYGGIFNGTVGHVWYHCILDSVVQRVLRKTPAHPRVFLATKVAVDSFVFGPVHVAAYFMVLSMVEHGGDLKIAVEKTRQEFVKTFAVELAVWPAVQAVNFAHVPAQYHLLVVNCVTVLDAAFMSWMQH